MISNSTIFTDIVSCRGNFENLLEESLLFNLVSFWNDCHGWTTYLLFPAFPSHFLSRQSRGSSCHSTFSFDSKKSVCYKIYLTLRLIAVYAAGANPIKLFLQLLLRLAISQKTLFFIMIQTAKLNCRNRKTKKCVSIDNDIRYTQGLMNSDSQLGTVHKTGETGACTGFKQYMCAKNGVKFIKPDCL